MNEAYANGSMNDFTRRLMKAREKTKTGKKKPGSKLAQAMKKRPRNDDGDHEYR